MRNEITATVRQLPSGKWKYSVRQDGVEQATRTSETRYSFVRVQRWQHDTDPSNWAPRFSRTAGKVGSAIDYGYLAENVEIVEVGPSRHEYKPVECGQCGHVHTTLKCDRCGF